MVKGANDGLLQASDGKMLVNDFTIITEHFTIINEHLTIISSFDHHWEVAPSAEWFKIGHLWVETNKNMNIITTEMWKRFDFKMCGVIIILITIW